jgi:hypothetical protein
VGAGTSDADFVHDTFSKGNLVLYRAGVKHVCQPYRNNSNLDA